jgi:hypothetical protein
MGKLWAIIEVLYQGKSLSDPAKWKKVQTLFTTILTILGGLKVLLPEELQLQFNDAALDQIANAVMIIGIGVVNVYGTVATTDKIGLNPKSK